MDKEKSLYNESEVLKRLNSWIDNGDKKISFGLAFAGVLLGVFFTSEIINQSLSKLIDNIIKIESTILISIIIIVILSGFIISLMLSIWCFIIGLKGTLNSPIKKQRNIEENSILHFETIKSMSFNEFSEKVNELRSEEMKNEYLSQIYINATICSTKFERYNKGIKYLMLSVVLFILLNFSFLMI